MCKIKTFKKKKEEKHVHKYTIRSMKKKNLFNENLPHTQTHTFEHFFCIFNHCMNWSIKTKSRCCIFGAWGIHSGHKPRYNHKQLSLYIFAEYRHDEKKYFGRKLEERESEVINLFFK